MRRRPNLPGFVLDYAHPLTRGLVGWWPMNAGAGERANDARGLNHGLLTNFAASGWVGGPHGRAIAFDGTDDYVTVADADALDITGDISICAWVNPSGTSGTRIVVSKSSGGFANPYLYWVVNSTNLMRFAMGNGAANTGVSSSTRLTAGRWSFVCVTMEGTTITHYLNGAVDLTSTLSATITGSSAALMFGGRADASQPFAGAMCHIRIYNRTLRALEVRQLYADPLAGAASAHGIPNMARFRRTLMQLGARAGSRAGR